MQQRGAAAWIVVGTLAVVGGFWLTVMIARALHASSEWTPFVAHIVCGLLAGAVMVAHAALRPWREPIVVGVAGVGVLAVMFLALPHPMFNWIAARSSHPWMMTLGLAALTAAGAGAGAMISRRVATTTPHVAKHLLFSALTVTGCTVTILHVVYGCGFSATSNNLILVLMLLGVAIGGFLTQLMVPIYRPWASGAGAMILVLVLVAEMGATQAAVSAVLGGLVLGVVGAIGARFARRWATQRDEASLEPLPSARLH